MRIAHFVHRYPPALGGSESYFARLSNHLAAGGDDIRVWTTNALDLEAFWSYKGRVLAAGQTNENGVELARYPISHWPGRRYILKALSFIPYRPLQCLALPCNPIVPAMWADSGQDQQIDIVHAGVFPYAWPIYCGLRLARRCGAPFVLTPFLHLGDANNPRDPTRRDYLSPPMRYLLNSADQVFVQTKLEFEALRDVGLAAEKLTLQGMGVDVAECTGGNRQRARQNWGIDDEVVVIGHLANKSVEKGTVDLLEAAQRLWQQGVFLQVVLAGPEMSNFVGYWNGLPPLKNVTRLGVLSEEEKRDFFAAIDVFAMPSRSDSFGIVFLEAWANGVPCVAYRAGGVAEVIQHDRNGLLADCGDIAGISDALEKLIRDSALRRTLGENGGRRVGQEFQWPPRLDLVRATYQHLIGRNRKARAQAQERLCSS